MTLSNAQMKYIQGIHTPIEIPNISIILENLFESLPHTALPPCNPCSEFYQYRLVLPNLELHINGSYSMYTSISGCFHSAKYFWDSSKLLCVLIVHSFYTWRVVNCTDIPQWFICSPIDGHLDHFQFGAILNKVDVDICIQVSCGIIFSFLLGKHLGWNGWVTPGSFTAASPTPTLKKLQTHQLMATVPFSSKILLFQLESGICSCYIFLSCGKIFIT